MQSIPHIFTAERALTLGVRPSLILALCQHAGGYRWRCAGVMSMKASAQRGARRTAGPQADAAPHSNSESVAAERDSIPLPTTAGDWRLLKLLAEGASCRVFAAQSARAPLGKPAPYVLKILHPRWHEYPESIALVKREAKVGRVVAHPRVVPVLAHHLREPPYFVVMPRLAGCTLADVLATQGPLAPRVAYWVARQAAEGLAAIHAAGFRHADIKPANIFVGPRGHVTIIDLGFARQLDEPSKGIDQLGLGTLNYLPPELLTSTVRADERSDIYSLGVVLYEMLAGRAPLAAQSLAGLLDLQHSTKPANLRSQRPDIAPEAAALVRQMLLRDPLRRPASMDEIVRRLWRLELEEMARASAANL